MRGKLAVLAGLVLYYSSGAPAQDMPAGRTTERMVPATDYRNCSEPVDIDFRGLPPMTQAQGRATALTKAGRTAIAARFEHLEPPTWYGPQYLTYVLWAVTPSGNARNLGELMADAAGQANVETSTDLPVFGMLVTAEPYAAVHQPDDVVVLEDEFPSAAGTASTIARATLVPGGQYSYSVPSQVTAAGSNTTGVPRDRYEVRLQVAEAQNAVQIAHAAKAEQYAPDSFTQAVQLLGEAKQFEARKADRNTIVSTARRAEQMAEAARVIATERRRIAEAAAQQTGIQGAADRDVPTGDGDGASMTEQNAHSVALPALATDPAKMELRARLLSQLNTVLPSVDTRRGLVVTLADADFSGGALRPEIYRPLTQVAAILQAHPQLLVAVEGNSDTPKEEREALERAIAVRGALVGGGAPVEAISARGMGSSRPLGPSDSAEGAARNRRVELIISGAPIGGVSTAGRSETAAPRP